MADKPKVVFETVQSTGLGAFCRQSPIEIQLDGKDSLPGDHHITLNCSDFPIACSLLEGGTLQVNPMQKNAAQLILEAGDHYKKEFDFQQLHFHTGAEHKVVQMGARTVKEAARKPAEVHMVFKTPSGEAAVIGIIFDIGAPNPAIEKILTAKEHRELGSINPQDLLPHGKDGIAYLPGSLTTSPYGEGVHWIVAQGENTMSKEQFTRLKKIMNVENARDLQNPEGRPILLGNIIKKGPELGTGA